MKTKTIFLTAILLAPFAGAAAVQPPVAPTQAVVSVQQVALPQVLNDEELDEVTGELVPLAIGLALVARAVAPYAAVAATNAVAAAAGAVGYYLGYEKGKK